jgi:hypothetical protein
MKKKRAVFVSLDLYYRSDVSAIHASHPCRGGRAVGGSREREGVSGGRSGDPMAVVVSIMSRACIENISSVILEALPECGRDQARRNGGGTMRCKTHVTLRELRSIFV